jgi:hypothetical protein
MFYECKDKTQSWVLSYWQMGQRTMINYEILDSILKERCDRFQQLLEEGRYEDAISIGEEFDEWIATCQSWPTK